MKELVKLVIMSHKRAGKVDTLKLISNCALCVSESQEAEYRKYYPNVEYLIHPDTVIGVTPKIKWIHKNVGDVVVLDDDLNTMSRNYVVNGDGEGYKVTCPDTAYEIIQANAYLAKEMGAKVFGFSTSARPVDYSPLQPFKLSGFVIGASTGYFKEFQMDSVDDSCVSASDYFISGVNAYYNRYCLIDTRYAFGSKEGTFKSKGGLSDFRTFETEKNDYMLLRKYFGDAVTRKHHSSTRAVAHPYERTLSVDW